MNTSKLLQGAFETIDAAAVTMGAEGKLAIMEGEFGLPEITKDGVTVLRKVFFKNKEKNLGAFLVKSGATQVLVKAGDSTTTFAVLTKAIIQQTEKKTLKDSAEGSSWQHGVKEHYFNSKVKNGIDVGFEEICSKLSQLAKPVDETALEKIAVISCNGDEKIGKMVYEAYKAVGLQGTVTTRSADRTYLDISKGFKFNKGWISPFLINDERKAAYEAQDAEIIIYNGYEIHNSEEIAKYINNNKDKAIVIVAERLTDEDWVRKLARINREGGFNVTAVEAPYYDKQREAFLEDLAVYTEGEVFIQGQSKEVKTGKALQAVVEESFTYFVRPEINEAVKEKIANLSQQLEIATDKEFIQNRIQHLSGLSATIFVGSENPNEKNEIKDRVEDAICAVRNSYEGYICGGGTTLVYISENMKQVFDNKDIQFGYDCIKKAICSCFNQIVINSRRNPEDYIEAAKKEYGIGYNAKTDSLSNLLDDYVFDSVKSTRIALEQAKSVAKLLLDTAVVITN